MDFESRASSKNEVLGGVSLFVDGNSVRIDKISVALDAGDAGGFKWFFIVAARFDDDFELAGGNSGEIKMEILRLEFGKSLNAGIGVSKP